MFSGLLAESGQVLDVEGKTTGRFKIDQAGIWAQQFPQVIQFGVKIGGLHTYSGHDLIHELAGGAVAGIDNQSVVACPQHRQ